MVVQEIYLNGPLTEWEAFDTGVWVPVYREYTWLAGEFHCLRPQKLWVYPWPVGG